jgi:hypothetical protein
MANEEDGKWKDSIASYLENPKEINQEVAEQIDEIAIKYDLEPEMSIIFAKARI